MIAVQIVVPRPGFGARRGKLGLLEGGLDRGNSF